jgi:branched-chain amino acid transport system substrate-binding protein
VTLARRWYDAEQVDAIFDIPNSGVALAVQQVAKQAGKIVVMSGAVTSELTGKQCSPTGFQWTSDSYALARGTARAVVLQGFKSWFFLTVDFAGGYSLERDAEPEVVNNGGKVVGKVHHPLNTSDFSSYLLQAQSSKAQVIALANGGGDTVNAIKQASEFGVTRGGQKLVSMFFNIGDVYALGLTAAQGLVFTEGFYWDHDEKTRAFSQRFFERQKAMPSQYQAGVYSAVTHYLRAVQAAGTDEGKVVAAKMRDLPVEDFFANGGVVRPDGRMTHDMYLMEVKKPEQSKGPWDVYNVLATIPGKEAFRPLAESECPLVSK